MQEKARGDGAQGTMIPMASFRNDPLSAVLKRDDGGVLLGRVLSGSFR